MNTITCPHCSKSIEISKALTHQLEEKIVKEQQEKHKLEIEKAKKEAQLAAEESIKEKIEKELESSKVAKQKVEDELFRLKKEYEENEKKRKQEEEKIRFEAQKKAEETEHLKLREKDLQIEQIKRANEDIRRANEDLKRKLEQGSQQRQGEALELDLEEKLKNLFPNDEFLPIPKGFEGADIWQKVKFKGEVVGSIIWETKRTKAWSNGWITKLKDDAAKISATEAIIVSLILPNNIASFDRKDGVWITTYEHAISICRYVRFLITSISRIKSSANQTEEEWGRIRDYMMGDTFKHKMTTHFDGIKALRDGLDAEKRSTILRWKKTESQIEKLDSNTIHFYGELRAIVPNLPEIKGIDHPLIEETNENLLDE